MNTFYTPELSQMVIEEKTRVGMIDNTFTGFYPVSDDSDHIVGWSVEISYGNRIISVPNFYPGVLEATFWNRLRIRRQLVKAKKNINKN